MKYLDAINIVEKECGGMFNFVSLQNYVDKTENHVATELEQYIARLSEESEEAASMAFTLYVQEWRNLIAKHWENFIVWKGLTNFRRDQKIDEDVERKELTTNAVIQRIMKRMADVRRANPEPVENMHPNLLEFINAAMQRRGGMRNGN